MGPNESWKEPVGTILACRKPLKVQLFGKKTVCQTKYMFFDRVELSGVLCSTEKNLCLLPDTVYI